MHISRIIIIFCSSVSRAEHDTDVLDGLWEWDLELALMQGNPRHIMVLQNKLVLHIAIAICTVLQQRLIPQYITSILKHQKLVNIQ